jgi:hypothetical protein
MTVTIFPETIPNDILGKKYPFVKEVNKVAVVKNIS